MRSVREAVDAYASEVLRYAVCADGVPGARDSEGGKEHMHAMTNNCPHCQAPVEIPPLHDDAFCPKCGELVRE